MVVLAIPYPLMPNSVAFSSTDLSNLANTPTYSSGRTYEISLPIFISTSKSKSKCSLINAEIFSLSFDGSFSMICRGKKFN